MPSNHNFTGGQQDPSDSFSPLISSDALERCAQLLASGEIEWPPGLSHQQSEELTERVRRNRRVRLVKLIAASITADLVREVAEHKR